MTTRRACQGPPIHRIEEGIRELDRGEKMSVDEAMTIIEKTWTCAVTDESSFNNVYK